MATQYQVQYTNFGHYASDKFNDFEDAVKFAKSKGFEATIHDVTNGGVAGSWSPFGGTNDWRNGHRYSKRGG